MAIPKLLVGGRKGGTAKSTTAAQLALSWAREGRSVLAIDLDSQAALTKLLGASPGDGVAEVIREEASIEAVAVRVGEGIDVVPAGSSIASAEVAVSAEVGRELILKGAIGQVAPGRWDVIVLDSGPQLGVTTAMAMVASTHLVIPVVPSFLSLAALREFLDTVRKVRERLNPDLELAGVLLTIVDRRLKLTGEVREILGGHDVPVLPVEIPIDSRLQAAPKGELPRVRALEAYDRLALVLAERIGLDTTDTKMREAS